MGFDLLSLTKERQDYLWGVVVEYKPLVFKLSFEMGIRDVDDAYHDVLQELLFRVHYYDSSKSSMLTWLHRCIRFALHRRKEDRHEELLDEPQYEHRDFYELEAKDTVQYIMGKLSKYNRAILQAHCQEGLTLQQIADLSGVSKGKIFRDVGIAKCKAVRLLKTMRDNVNQRAGERETGAVGGR